MCLHWLTRGGKKDDAIQMTRTQKSKRESRAPNISSLKTVDRPHLLRTQHIFPPWPTIFLVAPGQHNIQHNIKYR